MLASAGRKDGDVVLYLRRADEKARPNLVGEACERDCMVSDMLIEKVD